MAVEGIIIMDSAGSRVCGKYFSPRFTTPKDQASAARSAACGVAQRASEAVGVRGKAALKDSLNGTETGRQAHAPLLRLRQATCSSPV